MPAHSSSGQKPEARFARIIAALCQTSGGELRIKGADLDSIDKDIVLVLDWDSQSQELVVRSGSRFLEPYRISAEASAPWTTATAPQPAAPPSTPAPVRAELSPSQLADLEQKLMKRRVASLLQQDRAAAARREEELLRRAGVPSDSSRS